MTLYNKDYVQKKVWLKTISIPECKPFFFERCRVVIGFFKMNESGPPCSGRAKKKNLARFFSSAFLNTYFFGGGASAGFIRVLNQTSLFFDRKTPNETKICFGGKQEGSLFDTRRLKTQVERLNQKCP